MVLRVPVTLPPVLRDLIPGVVSGPDVPAEGRRVLITGASGTFGRAVADALTTRGAHVVGLDLTPRPDDPFHVVACDITDDASVGAGVGAALDRLGGLDILINNAGIGGPGPAEYAPGDAVHQALGINLLGTWRVTAAAKDALVSARGRVVVVASRAAVFPLPIAASYGVSKRAVVAYADSLRLELAPQVTVSTVYPSMVRSPIHDSTRRAGLSLDGVSHFESLDGVVAAVLAGALSRTAPRDVATSSRGTVEFLLARHLPALVDRIVTRKVAGRVAAGEFDDAELARGIVDRHRGIVGRQRDGAVADR